jgi:hypothetical protein
MEDPKRIHTTILIKRRISGEPGPPEMLQHGELAMNEVNNVLYFQTNNLSLSSEDPGTF